MEQKLKKELFTCSKYAIENKNQKEMDINNSKSFSKHVIKSSPKSKWWIFITYFYIHNKKIRNIQVYSGHSFVPLYQSYRDIDLFSCHTVYTGNQ